MSCALVVVVPDIPQTREGRLRADSVTLRSLLGGVDGLASVARKDIWLSILTNPFSLKFLIWPVELTLTAVCSSSLYASRAIGISFSFGILKSVILLMHFVDILRHDALHVQGKYCYRGLPDSSCSAGK